MLVKPFKFAFSTLTFAWAIRLSIVLFVIFSFECFAGVTRAIVLCFKEYKTDYCSSLALRAFGLAHPCTGLEGEVVVSSYLL